MTSRASIRKPVTYDASQPSNAYEEVAPSTRFRSLTDLSFASMPTQAFTPTVFGFASKESSQTPQEQLERVRRLTVDDAEMVLHAAQIQATYTNNEEPRRSRFGGRFGRFSFKFRKEHKQEAKTPLEHFKNAASKLFSKLSFIKPSSGATVVQLDIPPVPKPLAVPLQRSYSVTNGFQTPRRLSRQPSVSSFNSVATAPEFMYMANTRDVPENLFLNDPHPL
ncbi:hypothetical protein BCR33DRAFT_505949 [Rhizoclosmatium globosum]|uniref:Uncharacterized protein n=1 Tax=Rhizoclosmatium globosum TaxID=329046 RepID=A0A1Y2BKF6_9FUNG|nr:hypothetical protein BCR33DRAFT_505949 [Rhizoclosmatium globosum]|eukprot:ORY35253.1 hypothetical protein BCR33DRAFT_505949 [Rhizoclosmatium globosum]